MRSPLLGRRQASVEIIQLSSFVLSARSADLIDVDSAH
jgi:hypothetical protein